ncbi:cycloisomerase [Alienimonas californiensis]|uniref:Uncharacterized protein n=1 Tax=Alienimonas californiensis TaxID=2527989 RepID=A0A517PFD9_9PLAN|nr:cycloisomerase [Alienimonas californiensis]QDT18079.1 hypothetical protein CA12_42180 [Alienimonas californiensis]
MLHVLAFALLAPPLPVGAAFEEVATFKAPEAHQAVAVDADCFYAIGNRVIARYDKRTGERLATIEASDELPLIHMNGGVVQDGRLVVSHSNFPFTPMTGSIETFDAATLEHLDSESLGRTDGSLTAVLPGRPYPLPRRLGLPQTLVFAHYELPKIPGYGTGSARTEIVRELGERREGYLLPEPVVGRVRPHSVSGATNAGSRSLWLSGHDRPELYRVGFPPAGSEMVLEAIHPAPIAGQGIAADPVEPGVLWGTRRREGLVVKMRLNAAP